MSNKIGKFVNSDVSRPGFGAMGLSAYYGARDDEESKRTIQHAIDIGSTLIDTADMYGQGHNEDLIGEVLRKGDNRSKVFLVSKFGNRWDPVTKKRLPGIDATKEYVHEALAASTARLGSAPDVWILHRTSPDTPIEETAVALNEARTAGKCRYIGLSECSSTTLARAIKVTKIDVVEIEYSLWTQDIETNGVVDLCKQHDIAVLAYSPLGRGMLTGRYQSFKDFAGISGDVRSEMPRFSEENFEANYRIVEQLKKMASKKGCTTGQLALAWLIAQGPSIFPIPGTKSIKYLEENFAARDVTLNPEEELEMRRIVKESGVHGERYPADKMSTVNL